MTQPVSSFGRFLRELRRRRVYRTAALYIIGAWIIVQVADVAFPTFGIPDWGLRIIFLAAFFGFPVALVFGWMFEITLDGVARTPPVSEVDVETLDLRLRNRDYFILMGLILVLMAVTWGVSINVPPPDPDSSAQVETYTPPMQQVRPPANSIAVLPFLNMSADKDNEYFSDGVTEEILDDLAKLDGLQVSARTSSFFFKDKQFDIKAAAELLGVRYVLEGSVRKSNDKVRITAQLIEAENGFHLWSETYDRELKDIFAVQDDIAAQIVNALKLELGAEEAERLQSSPPTADLQAYELYLQGQFHFARRGEAPIQQAIEFFSAAIERDPNFAEAHAALGAAHAILQEYSDVTEDEAFALADPAIQQAIALDQTLGFAHTVLGYINMRRWNWLLADASFTTAIALAPGDATIRQWYSNFLNDAAWQQDGLGEALRTFAFDPVSPGANIVLALNYLWAGPNFNEHVTQQLIRARKLGYAGSLGDLLEFVVKLRSEKFAEALERYRLALETKNRDANWLQPFVAAMAEKVEQREAGSGKREETTHDSRLTTHVREAVDALASARRAGSIFASDHFLFLLLLDQPDAAFDVADGALNNRGFAYVWFLIPEAESFRRHERFVPMLDRIGLTRYWRQKGAHPDICHPQGDSFSCS